MEKKEKGSGRKGAERRTFSSFFLEASPAHLVPHSRFAEHSCGRESTVLDREMAFDGSKSACMGYFLF